MRKIINIFILCITAFIITVLIGNKTFKKDLLPFGICKDCNVILIQLDTLRAKSLPCYGNNKNTAPFLCDLAKRSFFFKNSYSLSSYTLDSTFSVFTSTLPSVHKMTVPFESLLNPKIRIIPEYLGENGYTNLYSGPLNESTLPLNNGLGRGFDQKTEAREPKDWIKAINSYKKNQKFFAFLHTFYVHDPYIPKKENLSLFYKDPIKVFITYEELCEKTVNAFINNHNSEFENMMLKKGNLYNCELFDEYNSYLKKTANTAGNQFAWDTYTNYYWETFDDLDAFEKRKYIKSLYETRIYELDNQLKKFFEFLQKNGFLKNTIVIMYGDHGEAFDEHGAWTHANNLYNEVIGVPLVVYVPNVNPYTITKPVSGIDIFPGILHLLGIKPDSELSRQLMGDNLFGFSKNDRYLISQFFADRKQAIYNSEWKLIIGNRKKLIKDYSKELFNLKKDPDEQQNIIRNYPNIAKNMEKELDSILSKQPFFEEKKESFPAWVNEELMNKLKQTGYH